MLEVIGVGFGRTGTLSLKLALERLGFAPCHHMTELVDNAEQTDLWARVAAGEPVDWDEVYRGYRATTDWPGAHYWRRLIEHFPQAKVILTVRDPQKWYESVRGSIYRVRSLPMPDGLDVKRRDFVDEMIWEREFGGRFEDADHAITVFNEHNEAVRREVPAERLLEFQVGDGWEPLCGFLGVPVPDEPFPRSNDRQAFADRVAQRLQAR
ncbi:sulfotransferase family protein [Actinoallomurus rhizosphaericola]|uniref:sulfotransferase family protein n=1 Tax=Actinoallomurus rhizosphaericola TaxID=2952536 RepID=UPI002092C7D7|nr:sulfotransferase family protein [Actinoallomurus rhizosphaericola]MCO5994820.1 sulfotransferase family protein [Actinoallomurus rhizosphaericola]